MKLRDRSSGSTSPRFLGLGTTAESVEKLTLRILGCLVGAAAGYGVMIFLPEQLQGHYIVAHDDPRVRAGDEVLSFGEADSRGA